MTAPGTTSLQPQCHPSYKSFMILNLWLLPALSPLRGDCVSPQPLPTVHNHHHTGTCIWVGKSTWSLEYWDLYSGGETHPVLVPSWFLLPFIFPAPTELI